MAAKNLQNLQESYSFAVFTVFDQINAAVLSIREFFQKH